MPHNSAIHSYEYLEDATVYLLSKGEVVAEVPKSPETILYTHHLDIDSLDYDSYSIKVVSESLGTAYSTEQKLPYETPFDSFLINHIENSTEFETFTYFNNDGQQAGFFLKDFIENSIFEGCYNYYSFTYTKVSIISLNGASNITINFY